MQNYFGPPIDVWSVAVVLYVMLIGEFPWGKAERCDDNFRIKTSQSYDWATPGTNGNILSPAAGLLIQAMTQGNPNDRASVDDIRRSRFLLGTHGTPTPTPDQALDGGVPGKCTSDMELSTPRGSDEPLVIEDHSMEDMFTDATPWPETWSDVLPTCPFSEAAANCFGGESGVSRSFNDEDVGNPPSQDDDEPPVFRGIDDSFLAHELVREGEEEWREEQRKDEAWKIRRRGGIVMEDASGSLVSRSLALTRAETVKLGPNNATTSNTSMNIVLKGEINHIMTLVYDALSTLDGYSVQWSKTDDRKISLSCNGQKAASTYAHVSGDQEVTLTFARRRGATSEEHYELVQRAMALNYS